MRNEVKGEFMTKQDILTLFEYDAWATERMLEAVRGLLEKHYTENIGSSAASVGSTLIHIHGACRLWLDRWLGRDDGRGLNTEMSSLDALRSRWNDLRKELNTFLQSVAENQLQAPLSYKDMKGRTHSQPLIQQMQHLVNHSTYHRGQVAAMLRQLGAQAVNTDLITYYRQKSS
jgi:uncharacterized damage-inducible protein DinB